MPRKSDLDKHADLIVREVKTRDWKESGASMNEAVLRVLLEDHAALARREPQWSAEVLGKRQAVIDAAVEWVAGERQHEQDDGARYFKAERALIEAVDALTKGAEA